MSSPSQPGLAALADAIAPDRVVGVPVGDVRGLSLDSRTVGPGDVFFAIPGARSDGFVHAPEAVARGALAVVAERETPGLGVPQLIVPRARDALADAADEWYGRPSDHLHVIGVTGTDGKTTTCFLAVAVLLAAGRRPGLIGTVDVRIGDAQQRATSGFTTPEAPELQSLLRQMVDAGNDSVVIETSSHALAQARVRNCRFAVGMVTTVTAEHLDLHATLEAYRAAKARLVEEAPIAILNRDDDTFEYLVAHARDRVISYGLAADAQVRAEGLDVGPHGSRFHAIGPGWETPVVLRLPGTFNVSNALAVLALAQAEGIDPELAATALGEVRSVPGRMERVDAGQPFGVVVDFAHTPDALAKVLRELRRLTAGKLIVVFGAPGERDRSQRPAMGRAVAELADLLVVADDTPRHEPPWQINEEIAAGARAAGATERERLWVIDDRRAAVAHAISLAEAGDILLLAGKGHESSIVYGDEARWWDEREVARQELAAAGYGGDEAR